MGVQPFTLIYMIDFVCTNEYHSSLVLSVHVVDERQACTFG